MLKIIIEVDSLADLAAVGAMIRGEVIDPATVTKLQGIARTLRIDRGALEGALDKVPQG